MALCTCRTGLRTSGLSWCDRFKWLPISDSLEFRRSMYLPNLALPPSVLLHVIIIFLISLIDHVFSKISLLNYTSFDDSLTLSHFFFLTSLSLYDLLAKPKNKGHVSCLSSLASRFLLEFFQVPNLQITIRSRAFTLRESYIMMTRTPRAHTWGEARNFFKSQRLYRGSKPR